VPSDLATLRLEPSVHTHTVVDGRVTRHLQSHFLDFLIDNASLVKTVHEQDLVTDLNRAWLPGGVASAIETLLGRRPAPGLSEGRIPLLVCGECGDLECGAVTAALDVGASEVTWSDFQWENGYEEPEPIDTLAEPVRFDRAQYEAELADAGHRVAALPEAEPLFRERSQRGRYFRWPWQCRTRDDRP
jgi:hypothetical protein